MGCSRWGRLPIDQWHSQGLPPVSYSSPSVVVYRKGRLFRPLRDLRVLGVCVEEPPRSFMACWYPSLGVWAIDVAASDSLASHVPDCYGIVTTFIIRPFYQGINMFWEHLLGDMSRQRAVSITGPQRGRGCVSCHSLFQLPYY